MDGRKGDGKGKLRKFCNLLCKSTLILCDLQNIEVWHVGVKLVVGLNKESWQVQRCVGLEATRQA